MAKNKAKKASEKVTTPAKASSKKAVAKKDAASAKKAAKGKNKNAKPGFFAGIVNYFTSVRTEMKRVTWPTKKELANFSIAVCVSLIVVGLVIAGLDALVSGGLVLLSGLRG